MGIFHYLFTYLACLELLEEILKVIFGVIMPKYRARDQISHNNVGQEEQHLLESAK